MAWKRKQSRYSWGTQVERELLQLLKPYFPVICRSSRSAGLFDVWAVGANYTWLFQVKRLGAHKTIYGPRYLNTLLRKLQAAVSNPNARVFVATRTNIGGRARWVFHYLEAV